MDRFFVYEWREMPFVFLALMIAFTLHEFAHAYLAYRFGDPTAKRMGRVTLNPRAHLDVFGTILIFIAGFGWAKPVPVNRGYFRYPRLMGIAVSAAGPLSNLLIAFVGLCIYYALNTFGVFDLMTYGVFHSTILFFDILIGLNLLLFVFNLIPLPPLDGYRIIEDLAPLHLREKMRQLEQWGVFIFLMLVFIPPLYKVTIMPIMSLRQDLFIWMNRLVNVLF